MALAKTYKAVHLAHRPENHITDDTFTVQNHPVLSAASLEDGQVLYRPDYLSLDPAMRGWLNDVRSYIPPVRIGEVMRGYGVGTVLASKSRDFQAGDQVFAHSGWTELCVLPAKPAFVEKLVVPPNGRITDCLGVLGLPGLTAYFVMIDVGRVKAGDFVVVSGAAGATGSVAGMIAKLKGARVLGIAGTDEKCRMLTETLGFDEALNYKDKDFANKFRAATKPLIDVFFDNVGGEVLSMALGRAKPHARFVMCGGISQYNVKNAEGPKNYLMIVTMRIRMEGFIVMDYEKQFDEARAQLAQWLAEGRLKRQETIIKGGIEKMPDALRALYAGLNTGKLMVEIERPTEPRASKL